MPKNELPEELRRLVSRSVAELGELIRREYGDACFRRIERIRRSMAALRDRSLPAQIRALRALHREFRTLKDSELEVIARSFTLMLELMNSCENSYRTHRLRHRPPDATVDSGDWISYVLTAHPTESRDPRNIHVFREIQRTLTQGWQAGWEAIRDDLRFWLEAAWNTPIARSRKPTVEDEAAHIYSIVLEAESMDAILAANRRFTRTYIRTWVGGDKDGHPGVDQRTLRGSLQLSRTILSGQALELLESARREIQASGTFDLRGRGRIAVTYRELRKALSSLRRLRPADGSKVKHASTILGRFIQEVRSELEALPPSLSKLVELHAVFPAWVIPLELRDSAQEIHGALKPRSRAAIRRMLEELKTLAQGSTPRLYARGLIISMTESEKDLRAAMELQRQVYRRRIPLPVIPLFETASALSRSSEIMTRMLRDRLFVQFARRAWSGYVEIMVGYSDSSKESGVLPSRLAIAASIRRIERVFSGRKAKGLQPIYFHGSGGSVDRGGGSLDQQTAWWPPSALHRFKATLQGEMVERAFSSEEIFLSQISKIVGERRRRGRKRPFASVPADARRAVRELARKVSETYGARISDPAFLELVEKATPYSYLDLLRMGSRPTRRTGTLSVFKLRAIPWILCWTQTRVLFPTWWGVGSAWRETPGTRRSLLKRAYRSDPLFRTFVDALGFTLAKVELAVFSVYLERGMPDASTEIARGFEREYRSALEFVRAVSGNRDLLHFRPWLGTSIRLRSPMIHPLNLVQLVALERERPELLRQTVTGIASGMLTTG